MGTKRHVDGFTKQNTNFILMLAYISTDKEW